MDTITASARLDVYADTLRGAAVSFQFALADPWKDGTYTTRAAWFARDPDAEEKIAAAVEAAVDARLAALNSHGCDVALARPLREYLRPVWPVVRAAFLEGKGPCPTSESVGPVFEFGVEFEDAIDPDAYVAACGQIARDRR